MGTKRLLVAIDDTDELGWDVGTGRFSRRLLDELAGRYSLDPRGSVRQQLLVDDRVPYTTHNSAACLRFDTEGDPREDVIAFCADRLSTDCAPNADPGLCVAFESEVPPEVVEWGHRAKSEVVDATEARDIADRAELFLDDYGGTGDGVVGALAAVGATAEGEDGRFIQFDGIRSFGETVPVETLLESGIAVVGPDGASVTTGTVRTDGWIRPQLRDGGPSLPVEGDGDHYLPANLSERGGG
jgi:hypothetical protein